MPLPVRSRRRRVGAEIEIVVGNFFLLEHEERIRLFTKSVEADPELPYEVLLRYVIADVHFCIPPTSTPSILDNQDDFVQLKAAQILTAMLR
jgi:V-type H+-transporting ATPase subunit H